MNTQSQYYNEKFLKNEKASLVALFKAIEYRLWCGEIYSHKNENKSNHLDFSMYQDRLCEDQEIHMSLYDNRDTLDTLYDLYFFAKYVPTNAKKHCHITICGDEYVIEDMYNSNIIAYKDLFECAEYIAKQINFLAYEWLSHENIHVLNDNSNNDLTIKRG
jgi:hypothetical protein